MSLYNIVGSSTLVAGQPEDISQVLANFQAIQTVLNGGIDNTNINAAAGIVPSKLAGYPSDVTKVLRGDGSWLGPMPNRITASTLAGGPPAGPSDGDIWLATAVDANNTVWQFRYNAGSASAYKWEFVGGGYLEVVVATDETYTADGAPHDATTVGPTATLARAGDYYVQAACSIYSAGATASSYCAMQPAISSGAFRAGTTVSYQPLPLPNGIEATPIFNDILAGVVAGATVKLQYVCGAGAGITPHVRFRRLLVQPQRVS